MDSEVAGKIDSIKNDRIHGASWLSMEAIDTINFAAEKSEAKNVTDFLGELKTISGELIKVRPSMAPIVNNVSSFLYQVFEKSREEKNVDMLKSFALSKGSEIIRHSEEAILKAAEHGAEFIADSDKLMTCSYSSTLCETLKIANQEGKGFHVLAAESKSSSGKAYGEIAAGLLELHKISAEVIPDEAINLHITRANKVFVGADSILSDGSLINGTPTHAVASAAKKADVPFYSICETAKFNAQSNFDERPELEEGFDNVPPSLITGIITEDGMINPGQIAFYIDKMRKAFKRVPRF
jgi:translation initiation factor 2B subunit (eIF-2B alpha/beta/delta family)